MDVEAGHTADENEHSFETHVPSMKASESHVKHDLSESQAETAWVFSDKAGIRQRLLQDLHFRTVHFHHDLHSRKQCQDLLTELEFQKPALLWIRLAGPFSGSGNRHDALRSEHLVRLIQQQRTKGRFVVVGANDRSQAWNLRAMREVFDDLHMSLHQWCNYEPHANQPCCSKIKLLTNFPFPSRDQCQCGSHEEHLHQKDIAHAHQKQCHVLGALTQALLQAMAVSSARGPHSQQTIAKGQPELNQDQLNYDEKGVKKSVRFSSLHAGPALPEASSHCGNNEIVLPCSPPNPVASQDQTVTKPFLQNQGVDFWLRSGQSLLVRVHVEPRAHLFSPSSVDSPVDVVLLSSARQTRVQGQDVPGAQLRGPVTLDDDWRNTPSQQLPFLWTGTTSFQITGCVNKPSGVQSSFPTESALRQKQKKAEGHVPKPRPKVVEQHADDCVENLSSLNTPFFRSQQLSQERVSTSPVNMSFSMP